MEVGKGVLVRDKVYRMEGRGGGWGCGGCSCVCVLAVWSPGQGLPCSQAVRGLTGYEERVMTECQIKDSAWKWERNACQ